MRPFLKPVLILILSLWMVPAWGQEVKLAGAQEIRARVLFTHLRCVVCQNQSIDSSDADVAKDLRAIVREQIKAGKTDIQIKEFLVARYGEYILLKPKFGWHTALLWSIPIIILLGGSLLLYQVLKKPRKVVDQELSKDEERELAGILDD